jgi:hypothetical protein
LLETAANEVARKALALEGHIMLRLINEEAEIDDLAKDEGVIPIKHAPKLLGVSTTSFYRHIRWKLPVVKLCPGRYGVKVADLRRWRREQVVQPAGAAVESTAAD